MYQNATKRGMNNKSRVCKKKDVKVQRSVSSKKNRRKAYRTQPILFRNLTTSRYPFLLASLIE